MTVAPHYDTFDLLKQAEERIAFMEIALRDLAAERDRWVARVKMLEDRISHAELALSGKKR